jgi:invasion protein IalB
MFRCIVLVFGFLIAFAIADSGWAQQNSPQPSPGKPAEQVQFTYSAWTKSCTREADINGQQICFTIKTGRIASGQLAVAAMLVEREGESRKTFRVLLPLGMQIVHGTRIIVDAGKPTQASYLFCLPDGCVSDYQATPEFVDSLRKGTNLIVQAINSNGKPVALPLPVGDFDPAFSGKPTDWNSFDGQQKTILTSLFRIRDERGQALTTSSLFFPLPWTKFCQKGKEADAKQVCFTGREGRTELGQPVIAVVVIEPEGGAKKILRVTLPLGMKIAAGIRVSVDDATAAQSSYVICLIHGCMADYDFTPGLLASLRNGRSLAVQAVENTGRAVSVALPLDDFSRGYDGPPTDRKALAR